MNNQNEDLQSDLEAIQELEEWRDELVNEILQSRSEALDWPCEEPNEIKDKVKQVRDLQAAIRQRLIIHNKHKEWKGNSLLKRSSVPSKFLMDVWGIKRK